MTSPTVCAICLTKDRPEMTMRAVRSFREQTYPRLKLLVMDTSNAAIEIDGPHVTVLHNAASVSRIGILRNSAALYCSVHMPYTPDILVHWDSDDISHPRRIEEQVALLQSSGADAVGYSDLLFWREGHGDNEPANPKAQCVCDSRPTTAMLCPKHDGTFRHVLPGAWLYRRQGRVTCPGTTLAYWRKTWQRLPFQDLPDPANPQSACEDGIWLNQFAVCGMRLETVSSTISSDAGAIRRSDLHEPRMIASIHSSNTQALHYRHLGPPEYTRVPQFDDWCREAMRL